MKAIIINDKYSTEFSQKLDEIFKNKISSEEKSERFIVLSSNKSPREIAEEVTKNYSKELIIYGEVSKNSTHILINIEGKFENSSHQDQAGAEIVIWLRCKYHVQNPIILLGFQSNQALLKAKPENLIINSKGCYYYRLPFDFRKILEKNFYGLSKDDFKDLKNFIKPAIDIESLRHKYANYWAIMQLWDIQKIYDNRFKIPYPEKIRQFNESLDFCLLYFIFGYGKPNLKHLIDVTKKLVIEQRDKEMDSLISIVEEIELYWDEIVDTEKKEEINANELKDIIDSLKELRKVKYYEDNPLNIEKQRLELIGKEFRQKLENYYSTLNTLKQNKTELESKVKISLEIRTLQKIKEEFDSVINHNVLDSCVVLQIDDQALDGWAEIFKEVIFGNNRKSADNFDVLIFDSEFKEGDDINAKIEKLMKSIQDKLTIRSYDLILLDLRILPIYDSAIGTNIHEISGVKLLKKIRSNFPEIPVVITTASNKIWSLKEIIHSGADGFWIKEGLDDSFSYENSLKNYQEFIFLVSKILGDKYKKFKEFGNQVKKIKNEKNIWWKRQINWLELGGSEVNMKKEGIPTYTTPNVDLINSILDDCVILYRDYLQRTVLENTFNPFALNGKKGDKKSIEKEWVLPSLIVQHATKILEYIHGFKEIRGNGRDYNIFSNRRLIESFTVVKRNEEFSGYEFYRDSDKKCYIPCRMDSIGGELFDMRNEFSHTKNIQNKGFEELNEFLEKLVCYLLDFEKNEIKFSTF